MLYLPAIQIDETMEVRIPCSIEDLLALCKSYIESETLGDTANEIFARNPGLLIYSLARFRNDLGEPPSRVSELAEWMDHEFFRNRIEYNCFESAQNFDIVQQGLVARWIQKKSWKRAARFLAAVTDLNRKQAKKLLDLVGYDSLDLTQVNPRAKAPSRSQDSDADQLPIRYLFNACGKLQNLRASFDTELQSKKLNAMKQLAYGASHEINNPLANIATRAQTLLAEESNASKRQRLSVIYAQAMRAHEMISDMMLFAQPPDVCFESVEIKPLVDQVISELATELTEHQIVVGVRQYPDSEKCELDSTHFSVALKALLVNSIEAIGQVGEIRIQIWKRDENKVGISVSDTGCSIDAEVAEQIFDPFYSGREAGRGLGFGLSKVWRIVDLHGGQIEFEFDDKWSSRFVISIPQQQSAIGARGDSRIDNCRAA